jgi:ring-1,2-phenylacetyl-CoA epoxidase subunit PaaE
VAAFVPVRVSKVERLCADAVAITLDVPAEHRDRFTFRPGQALTVRTDSGGVDERRSYSICAAAGSAPRIGVRAIDGGAVSGWLTGRVAPGDTIEVLPPSGVFALDDDQRAGLHVLIAAGSGITPMMSIAATVLDHPDGQVVLVYGNRRTDTVMFADELADLKDRYPTRFQLLHVLSREPREADLLSGRLDRERLDTLLDALVPVDDVAHWWLCGPHAMVEVARDVLAAHGVDPKRVHRELFYVEDVPPDPAVHVDAAPSGETSEVTVVLDGRSTAMTLPRDVPVLDSAQRVRADLPFACKGGVCGTCRARVVDGHVRMRRNFALEDAEVEQGFVLTCQSLPESDRVTIDFDA